MKCVRATLSPLILSCLLILSCKSPSPGRIVGSWYYNDFPGLMCEFKTNGKYSAKMMTKEGVNVSADGTYSVDGSSFTGGVPNISTDSSDQSAQIVMSGVMMRTNPAKGTIAWQSDDEFTITSRNELRGVDETVTWKRQK